MGLMFVTVWLMAGFYSLIVFLIGTATGIGVLEDPTLYKFGDKALTVVFFMVGGAIVAAVGMDLAKWFDSSMTKDGRSISEDFKEDFNRIMGKNQGQDWESNMGPDEVEIEAWKWVDSLDLNDLAAFTEYGDATVEYARQLAFDSAMQCENCYEYPCECDEVE